jgi:hypothetical protein
MSTAHPRDLANAVLEALRKREEPLPPGDALEQLFQLMYHASISREESQTICFHIIYIDPHNPDPAPPKRIVRDRWRFISLETPLEMTLENMRKIAPASDPRSSAFAVYPDSQGRMIVWGFIDQLNRYQEFLNYDARSGPERPGLFEARIVGPGHLLATINYERVGELRVNELRTETLNVFTPGPILDALSPGIESLRKYIEQVVPKEDYEEEISQHFTVIPWVTTIRRILLRTQGLGHGGALLLTPDISLAGLNVKYGLKYNRLRSALERCSATRMQRKAAWSRIIELHEAKEKFLSWKLYFNERVLDAGVGESERELEAAIWFVSLLTRVDGLVLMTPQLDVIGFGVEITFPNKPEHIQRATSVMADPANRQDTEYNYFGTRHRSMMRYCDKIPGAVGFVISQDGGVRAVTRIDETVVLWEDIRLRQEFKVSNTLSRERFRDDKLPAG